MLNVRGYRIKSIKINKPTAYNVCSRKNISKWYFIFFICQLNKINFSHVFCFNWGSNCAKINKKDRKESYLHTVRHNIPGILRRSEYLRPLLAGRYWIPSIKLLSQLHRDYLRERRRGPNKRESISRQAGKPVLPADLNGCYVSR